MKPNDITLLWQVNEIDAGIDNDEQLAETRLWRSVLVQALQDATVLSWAASASRDVSIERVASYRFIFDPMVSSHYDRVCVFANVDPSGFRRTVRGFLSRGERFLLRVNKDA